MTKKFVELINIATAQRRKVNAENKERIALLKTVGFAEVIPVKQPAKSKPKSKKAESKDDNVLGD